jgi:hypothetical protein
MTFIKEKIFQDKGRDLIILKKIQLYFIGMESCWNLLNGSSSSIRIGT